MHIDFAMYDEHLLNQNMDYVFFTNSEGKLKVYPEFHFNDIRKHAIYTSCNATRTMWCDREGNYHYPKDMDTSYLHNVIKLLRTVAEAKISDSKKVLGTSWGKISIYHQEVAKMTIDEYCQTHFIIWFALTNALKVRNNWFENNTQFLNPLPAIYGGAAGGGKINTFDGELKNLMAENRPISDVDKKIVDIQAEIYNLKDRIPSLDKKIIVAETKISNLGGQSSVHYNSSANLGKTLDMHHNRMNAISSRLDILTTTINAINNNMNNFLLKNVIKKKVVRRKK